MTAPLVIAHWQVGETLRHAGAPLQQGERAAIYLTNALTGWDSAEQKGQIPGFDVLLAERTAANAVKQDRPILVVIGNPPYNAYAGTSQAGENDAEGNSLVAPYKEGLREKWRIKKYNLDDLFVRFFRIAERRIAERTGRGIVCYITNFSWLFLPSYVAMRERFLREFDAIWVDSLNGDSRETGKLTPDGTPDPSVFSTSSNREGIRVGTAITTLVRQEPTSSRPADVFYREFWGADKKRNLLASLEKE
jgi:predicted helicase